MKTNKNSLKIKQVLIVVFFVLQGMMSCLSASISIKVDYVEYKGKVADSKNGDPIASAYLSVNGTNISTITNNEGEFSLKVPEGITGAMVTVSYLGYQSKILPLDYFEKENTRIELEESVEELSEISIFSSKDARGLVLDMLKKRDDNYINDQTQMTAFYRETIKKRRRNVSLSEAVVKIYKQPYTSSKRDEISIIKARKKTDYERLDTLALKLRGGPFNTIYLDVMKYPEFLFNQDEIDIYKFTFNKPTKINNRYLYVIDFVEKDHENPWYYGKLFVDAETHSLIKATYKLNVENRNAASSLFVKKKPAGARVYPVNVDYRIDYRESNGKWFYGYGNAQLEFVVNWKNKLFNSRYTINGEMAVTDWELDPDGKSKREKNLISPSVVMVDDVSGFSDPDFWGDNNIIEPEKSIENAIEKIQRQLEKDN
jgi:hypothetical protein